MNNIFLIGYMGTGKSAVASYMAKEYSMEVMEMDEILEKQEKMSISDIFEKYGETYFRDAETRLIKHICLQQNKIVSCGGGVVLRAQNIEEMRKSGKIVLLYAKAETILERVKNDNSRPLLKGNKNITFIENMLKQRQSKYEAAADIIIRTDDKQVADICSEILEQVKEMGE